MRTRYRIVDRRGPAVERDLLAMPAGTVFKGQIAQRIGTWMRVGSARCGEYALSLDMPDFLFDLTANGAPRIATDCIICPVAEFVVSTEGA